MPSYDPDNADDLLSSMVGSLNNTNFGEFITESNMIDTDIPEEGFREYLRAAFNITDAAFEHAKDNYIAYMSGSPMYKEGYFHWFPSGDPRPESSIVIDSAEYDGECWQLRIRTVYDGDKDADPKWGVHSTVYMQRKEWNGSSVWTMISKKDEPQLYTEGSDKEYDCVTYTWNTLKDPAYIDNDMVVADIPLGLKYSYKETYDGNGDMVRYMMNLGRILRTGEVTLTVEKKPAAASMDEAVEIFSERKTAYDSATQIAVGEIADFGRLSYRHLSVDQSYSYSEAYVTCAENASGEKLYVCWEFSRSKNMSLQNPLTADDPLFIEVAESLKLK